jgi:hypothetical protein
MALRPREKWGAGRAALIVDARSTQEPVSALSYGSQTVSSDGRLDGHFRMPVALRAVGSIS